MLLNKASHQTPLLFSRKFLQVATPDFRIDRHVDGPVTISPAPDPSKACAMHCRKRWRHCLASHCCV